MLKEERLDFCTECRKDTEYTLTKIMEKEVIRDKEYEFEYTAAVCKECGAQMNIPGLIDLNIRERDKQYRETEGIVSVEEIQKLMELYHIGKAPLSLALGFGEVTISRYLEGQMPSKNYSDIMRNALAYPHYMELLLNQNQEKVGETAYKKAKKAIEELKSLFDVSEKMLVAISYIFEQLQEVTPLALQKILYYIQGIYMAIFGTSMFEENCVAWQHGPVYEKVYYLFRDFKYNPIEDNRFALLSSKKQKLSDDEKKVINLVTATFGKYSGKVLETITHHEAPWQKAREGYDVDTRSHVIMEKEEIKAYFEKVAAQYSIDVEEGLNQYIEAQLNIT